MNRRSRGGCVDCRKAKVKCDEIKPHCGTCKRRRHACQGYASIATASVQSPTASISHSNKVSRRPVRQSSARKQLSPGFISIAVSDPDEEGRHEVVNDELSSKSAPRYKEAEEEEGGDAGTALKRPFSRFSEPVTTGYSSVTVPKAGHPLIMDPVLMTPRALGLIPPGVVSSTDRPTVELYFNRHPYELNISPEFVNEMNANVLAILHQSPHAIVDSLSAIGHSYLTGQAQSGQASLAVLNYRARILATLRTMQLSANDYNLEVMVFMLLSLSAVELIDGKTWTAPETTIPAIIANSASLISHHLSTGREISSLARYFIRALARQDMIISLVHLHRPMIPTSVWLDEAAQTTADRLMGYTAPLMPLLEELCALAEDIKSFLQQLNASQQHKEMDLHEDTAANPVIANITGSTMTQAGTRDTHSDRGAAPPIPEPVLPAIPTGPDTLPQEYVQRAQDLRLRIESWKPSIAHGLSFRKSRRYLSQASCYRSGALLYLFRLLHPPRPCDPSISSSTQIDGEATAKAHEVLMSVASGPDEVKMLLWPVFLAACEMSAEEDRQTVLDILDAIMVQRRTVTAQRTKMFVLKRVWSARDEGKEWNWMVLARQSPGECLPI